MREADAQWRPQAGEDQAVLNVLEQQRQPVSECLGDWLAGPWRNQQEQQPQQQQQQGLQQQRLAACRDPFALELRDGSLYVELGIRERVWEGMHVIQAIPGGSFVRMTVVDVQEEPFVGDSWPPNPVRLVDNDIVVTNQKWVHEYLAMVKPVLEIAAQLDVAMQYGGQQSGSAVHRVSEGASVKEAVDELRQIPLIKAKATQKDDSRQAMKRLEASCIYKLIQR